MSMLFTLLGDFLKNIIELKPKRVPVYNLHAVLCAESREVA